MSNYLKIMESIDILKELEQRNIKGRVSDDNLMVCCPFHTEKHPSMGISLKQESKGIYNCLACGETGRFFEIISYLDNIDYKQVEKNYENKIKKVVEPFALKKKLVNILNRREEWTKEKIRYLKKDILKQFQFPYGKYLDYLTKKRKLTLETIKKFNILCDDNLESIWYGRIVIPIFDVNNKLAGITFRFVGDCEKSEKVRKIKNSDVSKVLFGLNHIKDKRVLIGVEGEIDMVYLQQFNIPAVQTTKFLSKEMIKTILKYGSKFIYCPDGDVPWINRKKGQEKDCVKYQLKKLRKYLDVDYLKLPKDKDPNNLTAREVKKIFKNYIKEKL